jgi:lipoate-protein ligase A
MLEVYESSGPPHIDLAFEAWMLDRAAAGQPSVLLTTWPGPVVVLGYGQDPGDVDVELCRARRIPVLRRLTGGTGVVHVGDLGIGLALPGSHPWAGGVISLYGRFLDVLAPALRAFGAAVDRASDPARASRVRSPVCFLDQLSDTLLVDGRKAVGCAQTRRRGAVLIHAVVLLGLDVDLVARLFRVDPDAVAQGLAPAVAGGDGREIGRTVASHLADALGLDEQIRPAPTIDSSYLEPYGQARWAPLGID